MITITDILTTIESHKVISNTVAGTLAFGTGIGLASIVANNKRKKLVAEINKLKSDLDKELNSERTVRIRTRNEEELRVLNRLYVEMASEANDRFRKAKAQFEAGIIDRDELNKVSQDVIKYCNTLKACFEEERSKIGL